MNLNKIDTLVLSGGSILGISYLGLFQKLLEFNPKFLFNISTFYGTSVGAVACVFLAFGWDPTFLFNELNEISIKPKLEILHFLETFGLDSGENAINFLSDQLQKKCSENIKELTLLKFFEITNKTVYLTTCCVETGEILFLSHLNFPNLKLIHALRMTISIPFYFTPVIWKKKHYIDAGIVLNFPFKKEFFSKENVLGVNIQKSLNLEDDDLNIFSYISNVVSIIIGKQPLQSDNIITIKIPNDIKNKDLYNFNITNEFKLKLYNIGYNCITEKEQENLFHIAESDMNQTLIRHESDMNQT